MRVATLLSTLLVSLPALTATHANAEMIGGNPGPEHNYVCPHADGKPQLECYFDAVSHLYTMCRNVKSIEVIEFGYENSRAGVNAAKSESCLDKQKQNIARPYKAALHEVAKSKQAVDELHGLQDTWLAAMSELQWRDGETDDAYKARVAKPYDDFSHRIEGIRTRFAAVETKPPPKKAAGKAANPAKAKPAPKAKKH